MADPYELLKRDIYVLSRDLRLFSTFFSVKVEQLTLTDDEKDARREWNQQRERIESRFYALGRIPRENSTTLLLNCLVLPPKFTYYGEAARSSVNEQRATRYYPSELHDYSNEFDRIVATYRPTNSPINHYNTNLQHSIAVGDSYVSDEADERTFLRQTVWNKLEKFGFTHPEEEVIDLAPNAKIKKKGQPDYVTYAPSVLNREDTRTGLVKIRPSAIFEVKTSHNLLLPNHFAGENGIENGIQGHYYRGLASFTNAENPKRNAEWARVAHPIGQTLGYMVDNHCRYGALCCASKTYFIHIKESHQCMITKAYFTSDENYFKAWAAFLHEADQNYSGEPIFTTTPNGEQQTLVDWNWLPATPNLQQLESSARGPRTGVPRYPKRQRTGGHHGKESRTAHHDENETPTIPLHLANYSKLSPAAQKLAEQLVYDFELDFVPFVPETQLEFHDKLGEGRNGCVSKVTWNGTAVAVKQFDLCKRFDAYKKEVEAYKFLRDAWGKHVPTPFFVSRSLSGQIAYLGMTLGNEISDEQWEEKSEIYWEKFLNQVRILERDFDFRHLDVWENLRIRNFIVVGNDDVLAIDLEAWERAEGIVGRV